MEKNRIQIGLRVSEEIDLKLSDFAEDCGISKNAAINILIRLGLRAFEAGPANFQESQAPSRDSLEFEEYQKHGLSGTRLYKIFHSMKQRCYNPNATKFANYGGKNIVVCDEWLFDFQAFYGWAMKNGYEDDLTIDRIDSSKGYSPENCRWISFRENRMMRNTNFDCLLNALDMLIEYANVKYVEERLDAHGIKEY